MFNFINRRISKALVSAVLLGGAVGFQGVSYAELSETPPARAPKPIGFDQYIVYLANGVIDTNVSSPVEGVVGCEGMFCDGEYFQREIMGRSTEEIEDFKNEAIQFFVERFGIDPEDSDLAGRIVFRDFMTNPQWGYSLHTFAGRKVDADGWTVRDGGYTIIFTDPEGVELGGEFAGMVAKQNQAVFYGNYNVLAEKYRKAPPFDVVKTRDLVMTFRSSALANILEDGSMNFRCEILHDEWGSGLATGIVANEEMGGSLVQGVGRNVITFK